jgi:hypothetical protein
VVSWLFNGDHPPAPRFDVSGSYVLRAYPITVGPAVPARFTGYIDGGRIVVTATVDDTVEHRAIVRGPVALRLGVEPRVGPFSATFSGSGCTCGFARTPQLGSGSPTVSPLVA